MATISNSAVETLTFPKSLIPGRIGVVTVTYNSARLELYLFWREANH